MSAASDALYLVLTSLALGACFDPPVDLGTETSVGSSSDSPGDESGSSTSLSIADSSSGSFDAPPEVLGFTINGSTTPTEQQTTGTLVLDVDAVDDVGIERIDILDGDRVVATVTEAPYRTALFVSSADNGTHHYSARAFDAREQTDDSDLVPLSINVAGGVMIELREDIGTTTSPLYMGLPRAVAHSDEVVVTFTTPSPSEDLPSVAAKQYSAALSMLWESALSPEGEAALSKSHPIVTAEGELLLGGTHGTIEPSTMAVFQASTSDGIPQEPRFFAPTGGHSVTTVVAQLPTGEILLSPEPHVIEARTADLSRVLWTEEQFPEAPDDHLGLRGILGIDVSSNGDSLITFVPSTAVCGEQRAPCVRKLDAQGTILWTRPAASNLSMQAPVRARFDPLGRAITAGTDGNDNLHVEIYDPEGVSQHRFDVPIEHSLVATDLAIDPQGNILIVGAISDRLAHAWAARFTQNGQVLWSMTYDDLEPGLIGSIVSSVAITNEGRAYLTGAQQLSTPQALVLQGVAWLAAIEL